jgi:hypothetical protein
MVIVRRCVGAVNGAGIAAAKTPDYTITLATQQFDGDGYVDQMEFDLQRRGADVGADAITTSVDSYTNYLQTKYAVPKMWISDDRRNVHLQHGEHHRILTADTSPEPDLLDLVCHPLGQAVSNLYSVGAGLQYIMGTDAQGHDRHNRVAIMRVNIE